ncbi:MULTISPECIES: hypothetical protein [unclassified Streptomyces]|uniref:hypothetical protein n=1 Tax=unclassified Streptomyces TaxID=2593676 RepID=UPI00224FB0DB|nr:MULTISPECIES: hypothetical protein [unclassified Streptomyces]MCX5332732.1 hypothetical protein [Streptomyces sp. NBC_00140]MCX5362130.1 hypothetical protein [Streptomyces sp. NBC_00124]
MSRPLLALPLAALLATTACSAIATDKALPAKKPASPTTAAPTTAPPSPTTAPALTPAQAQAALITDTDLGEPWTMTEGAATWRDGLLKATANAPDCQRLLDTLYTEKFFGADAQVRARTGLDDTWNDAQLHHQVVADRPADVDKSLAWLKTLPKKCGRFTAATATGAVQNAEVTEVQLEKTGDARQGLRLTLNGESADGEETTLTLDLAAVRVGDDTIVLTNGGLGDVYAEITRAVAELGVKRLTDVRKQARAEV